MADNVVEVAPEQVQVDPKAELAQHMALALGTAVPEPIQAQEQATPEAVANTPIDHFSLLKEKFGYDTPETALKEIEELRAYKATPVVPEIKFENEASERLFKALAAGKTAEVYSYLEQDVKIDKLISAELNKDTAADLVKLGMQLKYKDLTQDEINYKFNKQFGVPPKPVMGVADDQEEFDAKLKAWEAVAADKQMELMIEAKLAKPELQNTKQKLVFPEIDSPVDPGYAHYLKMVDEYNNGADEAKKEYLKLTPESVEKKVLFNDEANKISFEFSYKPSPEKFKKAVEATVDEQAFWRLFDNPDGTPDRAKFLRVINYALDEDGVLVEAMKQSKNATIKASLPDNSQAGGLVRQMVTAPGEESEIDKQMRLRGIRK